MSETKKDLTKLLTEEMRGAHRVPALLFTSPTSSLSENNLAEYEVLPTEPLHTIAGHIKNLYQEMQYHLPREDKKTFLDLVAASFGGKDVKRGVDYRLSLVDVTKSLVVQQKLIQYHPLLLSLLEIQRALYLNESKRSSQLVLRLYNVSFVHAHLATTTFKNPKFLTRRKMFGQYFHAVAHAPRQLRIMSMASAHTENEERLFNFFKTISAKTSNHHPGNVLRNAFVRLQVSSIEQFKSCVLKCDARISKHADGLTFTNTKFSFEFIKNHSRLYQAHLERIADFLLEENNIWMETSDGIEFIDCSEILLQKRLHHFHSYTLEEELEYVKTCWVKCQKVPERIPAFLIYDDDGFKQVISTLKRRPNPFKKDSPESILPIHHSSPIKLHTINLNPITTEDNTNNSHAAVDNNNIGDLLVGDIDDSLAGDNNGIELKGNYSLDHSELNSIMSSHQSESINDSLVSTSRKRPVPSVVFTMEEEETAAVAAADERSKKKSFQYTVEKSKTAEVLLRLLPDEEILISQYAQIRKKFKGNQQQYGVDMKLISAKLEVKLQLLYDNLLKKLRDIELTHIKVTKTLDLNGNGTEYEETCSKISILNKLKLHFNIKTV